MKHIIIGTAGHIDHGKTELTRALTGVNTDRLQEEQERGITIVPGFARVELAPGILASIVDVPGHERFIRNMLSGATGMDLVLLTVAADEGFMPQTWEHLDILQLLGIQKGILVLTKCDLVEEAAIPAAAEACRQNVKGTFLEDAPIIPVSAVTGAGIGTLREEMVRLAAETALRHTERAFRLPVDRLFPVSGFGNVVTGTLAEGSVKIGDEIMIYPAGTRAKVRELQNHDAHVGRAQAGMRTAVSLSGSGSDALQAGCILARPGSMLMSSQADVFLRMAADARYEIKNNTQLHFYSGTAERTCRVRLLDHELLRAGETGYAQLKFEEPFAARNYDRFIIRFFSPVITVGGGIILDMQASRHRRNAPPVLERLACLNSGDSAQRILRRLLDCSDLAMTVRELADLENLGADEVYQLLRKLIGTQQVTILGKGYAAAEKLATLWEAAEKLLLLYHTENPLEPGIRLGELREKLFQPASRYVDAALQALSDRKLLRVEDGYAALSDFRPAYDAERAALRSRILAYYARAGITPPDNRAAAIEFSSCGKLYQQVSADMRRDGLLVVLSPSCCIHHSACELALDLLRALFTDHDQVTLADFRTAADISRKYAQLLLEYWDRQGITRRVGDARELLSR